MVKNIIIFILAVAVTFLTVYARIQTKESERQEHIAAKKMKHAKFCESRLLEQSAIFETRLDSLRVQLENCSTGK